MCDSPSAIYVTNGGQLSSTTPFTKVACGEHFSAAISMIGDLYTWGQTDSLQLGYATSNSKTLTSSPNSSTFDGGTITPNTIVSGGRLPAKRLLESRTGVGGSPIPRIVPQLAGQVISVAIGTDHVCAVDRRGQLYAWGRGAFSQLGLGDTKDRIEPCAVPGLTAPVRSVSAGWRYTVCVCEDGKVYSWGAGSAGQLGHENKLRRRAPTPIKYFDQLSNMVETVSCGETHVFALTEEGELYGWGSNENGRLGLSNNYKESSVPTLIDVCGGKKIVNVDAGNRHSACIDINGRLYTWGSGGNGRLGHGTTKDLSSPTNVLSTIMNKHVKLNSVACGFSHTSAIDVDGNLYVWGCGNSGRLGIKGSKHDDKVRPVKIGGEMKFHSVDLGSNHSLGILMNNNQMMAWGALGSVSNKGQVGPGKMDVDGIDISINSNTYTNTNNTNKTDKGETKQNRNNSDVIFAEFQAMSDDSDTTDDDDDDEVVHGVTLNRTMSSLGIRVKAPPTITDQEILADGGADPHPALRTPAILANGPTQPRVGMYTPRPGSHGNGKRQNVFPTDFEAESQDLTHLGALKVHTPSFAKMRADERLRGISKEDLPSYGSPSVDKIRPSTSSSNTISIGLHTPRPSDHNSDNRNNNKNDSNELPLPALFPPGLEGLTSNLMVRTPSMATAKAKDWGESPTLESLAEPEEDDTLVDGYELHEDEDTSYDRNVFVAESSSVSSLSPSSLSPPTSTTTFTTTTAIKSSSLPNKLDTIDNAKLQSALTKTTKYFSEYRFQSMISNMVRSLKKQHMLAVSKSLSHWRLSTKLEQMKFSALTTIRDVKLGYDLLGSRMMYRMLNKLSRRLLLRGWRSMMYNMLVGRATSRALDSTVDARSALQTRVKKLKDVEKTMKQRLQYHRNVMKDRLLKTTIRYGRDKLYYVSYDTGWLHFLLFISILKR
jgi:alpha-tubulin suppressor-like RCC1 family protein